MRTLALFLSMLALSVSGCGEKKLYLDASAPSPTESVPHALEVITDPLIYAAVRWQDGAWEPLGPSDGGHNIHQGFAGAFTYVGVSSHTNPVIKVPTPDVNCSSLRRTSNPFDIIGTATFSGRGLARS